MRGAWAHGNGGGVEESTWVYLARDLMHGLFVSVFECIFIMCFSNVQTGRLRVPEGVGNNQTKVIFLLSVAVSPSDGMSYAHTKGQNSQECPSKRVRFRGPRPKKALNIRKAQAGRRQQRGPSGPKTAERCACACACACARAHVRAHLRLRMCLHMCACACARARAHVRVRMRVLMCVLMCACLCARAHVRMRMCPCACACASACSCACACACV